MGGLANFLAQLLGSCFGAVLLCALFPCDADVTQNLASNVVTPNFGAGNALVAEIIMTFIVSQVAWKAMASPESTVSQNPCLAIGAAVFLAHLVLLPIDGCSINPTRSF